MHRKNRVFLSGLRVTGSGSGSRGFGVRLGCTHRSRAHRKSLLRPLDMEDRTSGRIGSHGFSQIRQVWLTGRGSKLLGSSGSAPSLPISDSPSLGLSVSLNISLSIPQVSVCSCEKKEGRRRRRREKIRKEEGKRAG
jgi:hypothetical protein